MRGATPNPPDPLIGRVIAGRFAIEAALGEGSMGRVYRARHLTLKKPVAVKVLRPQDGGRDQRVRRFKAEARAASRLDHPNVIRVLDFGEEESDGLLYLAMEYLSGEDLQVYLDRRGMLEPVRAFEHGAEILAALSHAHGQGVIHRDVKPGNVILFRRTDDDGREVESLKVLDFGLAKIVDPEGLDASGGPITRQGAIFGTPAYMSPEQAKGEPLDERSDLYSVGVMLYRMLSGEVPFRADSPWGILKLHISERAAPLSSRVALPDPRYQRVVERAMAKDPSQRYESARAMRAALLEVLEGPLAQGLSADEAPTEMNLPSAAEREPEARTLVRPGAPPRGASDTVFLLNQPKSKAPPPSAPLTDEHRGMGRWALWFGLLALALALALGVYVYFSLEGRDEVSTAVERAES